MNAKIEAILAAHEGRRMPLVRGKAVRHDLKATDVQPASAFAGSVAPISVRHFLMASGASSTRTTHGPDDMKAVRLAKNGRARWTA